MLTGRFFACLFVFAAFRACSFRKLHILNRTFCYKIYIYIRNRNCFANDLHVKPMTMITMWCGYMQICHVLHIKSQHKSFSFQPNVPKMNIYNTHGVWENDYVCACCILNRFWYALCQYIQRDVCKFSCMLVQN